MARIRILHASDLHFGAKPDAQIAFANIPLLPTMNSHSRRATNAFAYWAKQHANEFDVIVITGDLATTGQATDLQAAVEYLEGGPNRPPGSPYKPLLTDCGKHIVLIPGNHDRYSKNYVPANMEFDRVFKKHWRAGQRRGGVQHLWDDRPTPGGTPNLVILGADFTLLQTGKNTQPFNKRLLRAFGGWGMGQVTDVRIRRLRNLTATTRNAHPDCTIIWAIHFEPWCEDEFHKLVDDDLLVTAAERAGVPVVLCGHSHRSAVRAVGSFTCLVCGTTGQHSAAGGNIFHLVDLDVGPVANQVNAMHVAIYRFSDATNDFERVREFRA